MNDPAPNLRTDVQITLVEGNADRFKQQAVQALAVGWLREELEYGLTHVDASEVQLAGVLAQLLAGSLIARRRLVVVRDITSLSASEQQQLAGTLADLQPETAVALVASKHSWDAARSASAGLSRALVKVARERGQLLTIVAPPVRQLPVWVTSQMRQLGKNLAAEAARLLVDTVGEDADRLLSELEKLACYVGDREQVTAEDVRAVCVATAEERVWEFLDAVGERDSARALKLLDGMLPAGAEKSAAIPLLGSIARQLRLLWQVRLLHQMKVLPGSVQSLPPEVAARLPAHQNIMDAVRGRPRLLDKFSRQARMFRDGELARALDSVYRADVQLKGLGARYEERTILELLVVELCTGERERT